MLMLMPEEPYAHVSLKLTCEGQAPQQNFDPPCRSDYIYSSEVFGIPTRDKLYDLGDPLNCRLVLLLYALM